MSASERRPLRDRATLFFARWLLGPVAWLLPRSGWARLYQRIRGVERGVERDGRGDPSGGDGRRPDLRRVMAPKGVLVVLLCAAFALWLRDVLRRPAPEPAVHRTACTVSR